MGSGELLSLLTILGFSSNDYSTEQMIPQQEIGPFFCTELNQPILPNIRKWKGPRGCWKFIVSETPSTQLQKGPGFAGFLWDTAAGVELRDAAWQESSPGNGHGKPVGPSPYLARFKVGSNDLILVNLHLAALTFPGSENPSRNHSDNHR
ncbi:endonuclease/exonuclease/phosphatase family domain-containing protein 1-like [Vicugna pacos]|uniref:Endonuclease/exonuclease/phosphatase family domain-containing protein 1-like n=1 Tax=Vicugna pacos TaxID=30538 RepID=A0ABM5CZG4_VICPA